MLYCAYPLYKKTPATLSYEGIWRCRGKQKKSATREQTEWTRVENLKCTLNVKTKNFLNIVPILLKALPCSCLTPATDTRSHCFSTIETLAPVTICWEKLKSLHVGTQIESTRCTTYNCERVLILLQSVDFKPQKSQHTKRLIKYRNNCYTQEEKPRRLALPWDRCGRSAGPHKLQNLLPKAPSCTPWPGHTPAQQQRLLKRPSKRSNLTDKLRSCCKFEQQLGDRNIIQSTA